MPNSSSYDDALDAIANQLQATDEAFAQRLREAKLDAGQSIFLDGVEAESFKTFESATIAAFEQVARSPDANGWLVAMFSALKALARSDSRAAGAANAEVHLLVDGAAIWSGPQWLAEAVLEHLAGYVWNNGHRDLAQRLLDDRAQLQTGALELESLRHLPAPDAAALREAVQFFTQRYTRTQETYAPDFLPQMHAALQAVQDGLHLSPTATPVDR
jgi:hypothetical protein